MKSEYISSVLNKYIQYYCLKLESYHCHQAEILYGFGVFLSLCCGKGFLSHNIYFKCVVRYPQFTVCGNMFLVQMKAAIKSRWSTDHQIFTCYTAYEVIPKTQSTFDCVYIYKNTLTTLLYSLSLNITFLRKWKLSENIFSMCKFYIKNHL